MNKNIKKRRSNTLDLSITKKHNPYYIRKLSGKESTESSDGSSGVKKGFKGSESLASGIEAIAGAATSIIGAGVQNAQIADTTAVENQQDELSDTTFDTNSTDSLLNQWNSINWMSDDWSAKDVRGLSGGEMASNTMGAAVSGATAGAQVGGPWGAVIGGVAGLGSGLAGIFAGNRKARNKAKELNRNAQLANRDATKNFNLAVENQAADTSRAALLANYAAEGGPIHIKKENRGKFTESAKRAGMGVQEFARHVLANKENYSPLMRRRANFARNANKWKHDEGGSLNLEWPLNGESFGSSPLRENYVQAESEIKFDDISTTRNRPYNSDYISYIYDRLKNTYLGDKQIAAIIGSIIEESGGNPFIASDTGKYKGLLQWDADRYTSESDDVYDELDRQIQYILRSITNTSDGKSWTHGGKGSGYSSLKEPYNKFYNDDLDVGEITKAFNLGYVRPHGKHESADNRGKVAEQVYSLIKNNKKVDKTALNALNKAEKSKADFVKRLKDEDRDAISDWKNPDKKATHKMSWGEDDTGAFIYPEVSGVSGKLVDYSRVPFSPEAAADKALESNDYIRMSPEEVEWFTTNYKDYYPKFSSYDKGGKLNSTHGGDYFNGLIKIDEGGTHEANPFEGVPMGIAEDGIPNLVEEGEVIYNDYVYSNRLYPKEKDLMMIGLPKKYKNSTYAYIAEDMGKESEERPNDPISRRGLEDSLGKLAILQEEERHKRNLSGENRLMSKGGPKRKPLIKVEKVTPSKSVQEKIDNYTKSVMDPIYGEGFYDALSAASNVVHNGKNLPEVKLKRNFPTKNNNDNGLPTYLRYTPAAISAIGALSSVFAKPDYSNADILFDTAKNLSRPTVKPKLLANKLSYNPLDRNYLLNQLRNESAATRRAIMNSGINPASAVGTMLAADYNAQNNIGNAIMQMEQYNRGLEERVKNFNRATDQYNSQMLMQADLANAQMLQNRDRLASSLIGSGVGVRENADAMLEQSRSNNITLLGDNLGEIGRENFIFNQIKSNPDLYYDYIKNNGIMSYKGKKGGRLYTSTKRRNR